jgi:DNA repair exonuclease SbcCD ATPase subunit
MTSDITATASATRETGREPFSALVGFVDEKRFESEIRRIDTVAADEKKNREKFETRIEKTISNLRDDMVERFEKVDARFEKVDARFDKVDARFEKVDARFEKVESEIKYLRSEMNGRMDRLDDRLWWIFGAVVLSILVPVVLRYL